MARRSRHLKGRGTNTGWGRLPFWLTPYDTLGTILGSGFSGLLRNTSGSALNALIAAFLASGVFIEANRASYSASSDRNGWRRSPGFSALVPTQEYKAKSLKNASQTCRGRTKCIARGAASSDVCATPLLEVIRRGGLLGHGDAGKYGRIQFFR